MSCSSDNISEGQPSLHQLQQSERERRHGEDDANVERGTTVAASMAQCHGDIKRT